MLNDMLGRIRTREKTPELSLEDYFDQCKTEPLRYATIHERLLRAIGEPDIIDTRKDERLGRLFANQKLKTYKAFDDFYGMEDTILKVVGFLKSAAMGLEESRQILYLLGPVGSAKSSLAERLKDLAEMHPIYVLGFKVNGKVVPSPLYESPLGLIPRGKDARELSDKFEIPLRHFTGIHSGWAVKRLQEGCDPVVLEMYPSRLNEIGIAKTEPGDDNNQDTTTLVGKVNIRMLEDYDQNDPDAYSFSGALNKATQGVMEFVEMFKAPLKMLHPLLTATQESNYMGSEQIGALPFRGMILAHSNHSEWGKFRANKDNEAFLDRVCKVDAKYNLRLTEEQKICLKIMKESDLKVNLIAPHTLEMLSRITVASRLEEPLGSKLSLISKIKIYDGQSLKNEDPSAKALQQYREDVTLDEGNDGLSTRFAFKAIAQAYLAGEEESLDVTELVHVLRKEIKELRLPEEKEVKLFGFIDEQIKDWYLPQIGSDLNEARLEDNDGFCQNRFDRYFYLADSWLAGDDYQDPDSGHRLNKKAIDEKLSEIEKPAGIANPKDFRTEVVQYILRYGKNNGGKLPRWDSYAQLANVIKADVASKNTDLLPLISFELKRDAETEKKTLDFRARMMSKGYTEAQLRRLVAVYQKKDISA